MKTVTLNALSDVWNEKQGVKPEEAFNILLEKKKKLEIEITGTPKNCNTKLFYLDKEWKYTNDLINGIKAKHPNLEEPTEPYDLYKYFFAEAKFLLSKLTFQSIVDRAKLKRSQVLNKNKTFYTKPNMKGKF